MNYSICFTELSICDNSGADTNKFILIEKQYYSLTENACVRVCVFVKEFD